MEEITLRVFEIVGNQICTSADDGQKVYEQVAKILKENQRVRISFANVQSLTSAFLNPAIGQLYGKFSEKKIKNNLVISDMSPEDMALLKRVVETAKLYFKDPQRLANAKKKTFGESDE